MESLLQVHNLIGMQIVICVIIETYYPFLLLLCYLCEVNLETCKILRVTVK